MSSDTVFHDVLTTLDKIEAALEDRTRAGEVIGQVRTLRRTVRTHLAGLPSLPGATTTIHMPRNTPEVIEL